MHTNNASDQATQELERLLAQPLTEVCQWENSLYDELAGSLQNSVVLFGAGGLGRKTLMGLRNIGIEPLAFADNNPNLHGRHINGLRVLSAAQAAYEFGKTAIFLITVYTDSAPGGIELIKKNLTELGCQRVLSFVPLYWKHPVQFLPHYVYDLPHKLIESAESIRKAWSLFEDEISLNEYLAQILWRLNPEFDQIPAQADHEIYFPPDLFKLGKMKYLWIAGPTRAIPFAVFFSRQKGSLKHCLHLSQTRPIIKIY